MVTYSKLTSAMSGGGPAAPGPRPRGPPRYKTFSGRPQYCLVLGALHKLQESGFYWGAITGREADALLAPEPAGTFLVRDSSDHRHFFTLSVRTAADTKNLRVHCDAAAFSLQTADAQSALAAPRFGCVLQLVHYYMSHGRAAAAAAAGTGYYIYSGGVRTPLELLRPLPSALSTLQHLCRKTVNGHLGVGAGHLGVGAGHGEQLPRSLKEFLQEYDSPI